MAEDLARALGASGGNPVMIGGKECVPRPLGIQELTEVERDCVKRYRRQYLESYAENLDFLPDGQRAEMMARKIEEASRWDVSDLPPKHACDPKSVVLTDALKAWVREAFDMEKDMDDNRMKVLVASASDQGMLSDEDIKRLSGKPPRKVKVPYSSWWITGSFEGMITFVWVCFRSSGVTREQVADATRGNMALLSTVARDIEKLSSPEAGNG